MNKFLFVYSYDKRIRRMVLNLKCRPPLEATKKKRACYFFMRAYLHVQAFLPPKRTFFPIVLHAILLFFLPSGPFSSPYFSYIMLSPAQMLSLFFSFFLPFLHLELCRRPKAAGAKKRIRFFILSRPWTD